MLAKKFYILFLFLFLHIILIGQSSLIGIKAPDIFFANIINDTQKQCKLSDFKGKIILIDFWATWCRPCISSFSILDSLQKQYKDELKIITVTTEKEDKVRAFLTKNKIRFPIVIDQYYYISNFFPHRILPHNILINKEGYICAVTNSENLNRSVINQIIKNDTTLRIEEKKDIIDFDVSRYSVSENQNIISQITLTPGIKGAPSVSTKLIEGRMKLINMLPSSIYEWLFDFNPLIRTIWKTNAQKYQFLFDNLYCLEIYAPNKSEREAKEILKKYLNQSIPLKAKIEKREVIVKILKRKKNGVNLVQSDSVTDIKYYPSNGKFEMRNQYISYFIKYLEVGLNTPVVDETGLKDKYDLKIEINNKKIELLLLELEKYGLELIEGKRLIDYLILFE